MLVEAYTNSPTIWGSAAKVFLKYLKGMGCNAKENIYCIGNLN